MAVATTEASELALAEDSLIGELVEVYGVVGPVQPYQNAEEIAEWGAKEILPAAQVNGLHGRCVDWWDGDGKYVVQTFCGHFLPVPPTCVKAWEPPAPEDGGFDLAWPSDMPDGPKGVESLNVFAEPMAEIVEEKGFCLIQMTMADWLREELVYQAHTIGPSPVAAELLPDYLGKKGSGKISFLEYTGKFTLANNEEGFPWALSDCDKELTELGKALIPHAPTVMGFETAGRRKGMVWTPYASEAEAQELLAERLTDEDVDAGVLEGHLKFLKNRKLCFMRWIDNDGGEIILQPRPDWSDQAPIKLPVSKGKLLVFRCDWMGFSYVPKGENAVALTTWIMATEPPPTGLIKSHLSIGDDNQYSEALGILTGPPMPMGFRMHLMSCHAHMVGQVNDLHQQQSMFQAGCDGFEKIPLTRFDTDIYCYDLNGGTHMNFWQSYVKHAGLCPTTDLTMFDNSFFRIAETEARFMGPNQRLIMEDGYKAFQMAGFNKRTLWNRKTTVMVGTTGDDFAGGQAMSMMKNAEVPHRHAEPGQANGYCVASAYMGTGTGGMIASRLSYFLGLTGSTNTIDTACSASLVGVAVAVTGMRRTLTGESTKMDCHNVDAQCLGVNTLTSPNAFIGLCGPSMLSKQGRCFTFDHAAEGYARGEGVCSCYVRGSDSAEDNMNQLACLMGCVVNQDGRSATLTAPNGMAQRQCIAESMRDAGVVANQITVAECHGTGTALGDPIEVGALRGAMEPRATPLLTASSKSNIGHMEACAGMTGLHRCIQMAAQSMGYPNIHLMELNPHLDVDGFPAYFETEAVDTGLNSNYSGVSSFGFSGTNARADVWSQCKTGPRQAGKPGKLLEDTVDQFHRLCPITLGPIEVLTGEAVTRSFRLKAKYKADSLRDEWAPYDISSDAYEGGYRYRREPLASESHLDLPYTSTVSVYGSWSSWSRADEMKRMGDGWFTTSVALGDCRYELFYFALNKDGAQEIYPTVTNAAEHIWIEGPDKKRNGRTWIIDGRDKQVPVGTTYELWFKWQPDKMSVLWKEVPRAKLTTGLCPSGEHSYSLVGTFGSGFLGMSFVKSEGAWEGQFRIGTTCEEEFAIAKDKDMNQLIYPQQAHTALRGVPVRGPDNMGRDKRWKISGVHSDIVTVKLKIVDAHVVVTASSEAKGIRYWESEEGWDRHTYCVVGSWNDWQPVIMSMDADSPGVFKAFGKVQNVDSLESYLYSESFMVCIDEDLNLVIHPEVEYATAGEAIAIGPDTNELARTWTLKSVEPDRRFEITLDLNAKDRRKMLTTSWM